MVQTQIHEHTCTKYVQVQPQIQPNWFFPFQKDRISKSANWTVLLDYLAHIIPDCHVYSSIQSLSSKGNICYRAYFVVSNPNWTFHWDAPDIEETYQKDVLISFDWLPVNRIHRNGSRASFLRLCVCQKTNLWLNFTKTLSLKYQK